MNERGSTVETNDKLNETQKSIIEMIKKIDNIDNLKRIYKLTEYLYVYK